MRTVHGLLMTLALLVAMVAAGQVQAQEIAPFSPGGAPHIATSLDAETLRPAPGQSVAMALVMQPETGWHGYWNNPGDAGVGLSIDWSLPDGMSASAFRYPVPQKLVIAGLMNHVYEHDYALLFDAKVPQDAKPGDKLALKGAANWLACTDNICVPERGTVEIVLTVGEGSIAAADRERFDGYRADMPRPLDQKAQYAQANGTLSIAVPYPASAPVGEPWFFAETTGRVLYAKPQSARRLGDLLIVDIAADPEAPKSGPIEGVLAVAPDVALKIAAQPGTVPAGGDPVGGAPKAPFSWVGFALILGGALLGGLILNIMPCVFPILSLKAISLAKAGGDEKASRREALAYTLGILVTCLGLGALMLAIKAGGTQVGWAFQLQEPRVVALLIVLAVAITFNLAGVFELSVISTGQDKAAKGGLGGAFWTGALAAFVATPCAGPFLGVAMGAALVLPWPLALTVFAGLALGLASPFIAIAFVPALRAMMPRPGKWMDIFRKVMAIPMGLTAAALVWLLSRQLGDGGTSLGLALALWTAMLLLLLGRAQQQGKSVHWGVLAGAVAVVLATGVIAPGFVRGGKVAAGEGLTGQPFSETKLAELRAAGKPVFLYFTADWCLSCKVNEANAIDRAAVRKAFEKSGVETMVGDWTSADAAITRFLEAHGRSGVPLYLYYPKGAREPQVLPQVLTVGTLTDLVKG